MPHTDYFPFTRIKLAEDGSSRLHKQLGDMEGEVKEIQMELEAIRKDRLDLHSHKQPKVLAENEDKEKPVHVQHIRDESFSRHSEISKLREDLLRAKNQADEERLKREKYEDKLKDLEVKLNSIISPGEPMDAKIFGIHDRHKHNDVAEEGNLKTQIRNLREELEEARLNAKEKNDELQEYRAKYLQAQQLAEELRRQLDVVDYDNRQVSDQIQIEIQKMKMQFQEKLTELSPLPDLLKGAQIQLQEAKQFQRLAEENSQQLSGELHRVKEKLVMAVNSLNQEKIEKAEVIEENKSLITTVEEKQKEIELIKRELEESLSKTLRLQEKLALLESRYGEKSAECSGLLKDLEELRLESDRAIVRNKERAESNRRYLQTQISELESQLIQSRARCRSLQKERDEIRQKVQTQINNLQENFELSEIRLKVLHKQVVSLKSTYSVILSDEAEDCEYNKIVTA